MVFVAERENIVLVGWFWSAVRSQAGRQESPPTTPPACFHTLCCCCCCFIFPLLRLSVRVGRLWTPTVCRTRLNASEDRAGRLSRFKRDFGAYECSGLLLWESCSPSSLCYHPNSNSVGLSPFFCVKTVLMSWAWHAYNSTATWPP